MGTTDAFNKSAEHKTTTADFLSELPAFKKLFSEFERILFAYLPDGVEGLTQEQQENSEADFKRIYEIKQNLQTLYEGYSYQNEFGMPDYDKDFSSPRDQAQQSGESTFGLPDEQGNFASPRERELWRRNNNFGMPDYD